MENLSLPLELLFTIQVRVHTAMNLVHLLSGYGMKFMVWAPFFWKSCLHQRFILKIYSILYWYHYKWGFCTSTGNTLSNIKIVCVLSDIRYEVFTVVKHSYCGLLRHDTIQYGMWKPTFWRNTLPPGWRQYIPLKTFVFTHLTAQCHNSEDHNIKICYLV
jgi:hypothetical protein